jgi:hypothetical protein
MFVSPAFAQTSDTSGTLASFLPLIIIVGIGLYVWFARDAKRRSEAWYPQSSAGIQEIPQPTAGNQDRQIVIKTYGGTQSEAALRFQSDAVSMAERGYFPTSQSWTPGQWSAGAYFAAVLLIFLFGLGILILGYMLIVKPAGSLTVTYQLKPPVDEKTCPMCAERIKSAALVCHFCGHKFSSEEVGSAAQSSHEVRTGMDTTREKA